MSDMNESGLSEENRIAQIAEQNGADLARANLLRMRSDYRAAIDQCLSLLKRSPDDPDAHTLIGDIYAEQGDLGQAAQWYELALDLNPGSTQDQQKLTYVQQRIKEREAATVAQQIALPPASPYPWMPWVVMAVIALLIGAGAYMAGQRQEPPAKLARASVPVSAAITEPGLKVTELPSVTEGGSPPVAEEDRKLAASIAGEIPTGIVLLHAWQDPRNRDISLTIRVRPEDAQRVVAAEIARAVLRRVAGANAVSVRTEKGGQIVHLGTVDRARLSVTETPGWSEAHPGAEALADALLAQEWPETAAGTPPTTGGDDTPPAATTTTGQNSGSATNGTPSGDTAGNP